MLKVFHSPVLRYELYGLGNLKSPSMCHVALYVLYVHRQRFAGFRSAVHDVNEKTVVRGGFAFKLKACH
jgi:hypothetical protein